MKKIYDAAVKTGEYQDEHGDWKGRYENVGAVIKGEDGPFLVLKRTFNPAGVTVEEGRDSIIVSLFEPRDDSNGGGERSEKRANGGKGKGNTGSARKTGSRQGRDNNDDSGGF